MARNHFPSEHCLRLNEDRRDSAEVRETWGDKQRLMMQKSVLRLITNKSQDRGKKGSIELCVDVKAAELCPGPGSPPVKFIHWLRIVEYLCAHAPVM